MDPAVFLSTFGLLFVAELGDKTQLMAMSLAHRYRALPVIVGSFAAFFVLNVLAVLLGGGLATLVPRPLLLAVAALLFIAFAWQSWRDVGDEEEAEMSRGRRFGAVLTSFLLIFLAELGDKTQLAMVALAARGEALLAVFLGGTAALWLVALLGIIFGRTLLTRIPARVVHRSAALLFALFGLLALAEAVRLVLA
ncbi:MAG TPA: UPF0016 domain-containing protein [Halieaceae bacterium]|nr:UPF0016 domain-containing protein [Halieaceae bacterium]